MMRRKIAVIDADLIGRKKHRFPNLCCMKISGYFKSQGAAVTSQTNYENLEEYDKVFIAKVFTDTPVPDGGLFGNILNLPNVEYGGTGFFYDKAQPLPDEIEHHMPDYHLYEGFCNDKHFTDYSIGFLTRGCFRHCPFCVNQRANKVVAHSPLAEFLDTSRKKICLLDDNFFGYSGWKELLKQLIDTGKAFTFKQGLDVRILDEEKAELLFSAKYDGDYIFAFDNIKDAPLIEEKLQLLQRYTKKRVKFYILCGYDRRGKYDDEFWRQDIEGVFRRIELLRKYGAIPYLMRHQNYELSPYRGMYITLAEYCNMPQLFQKMSFEEFVFARSDRCPSRIRYFENWKNLNHSD